MQQGVDHYIEIVIRFDIIQADVTWQVWFRSEIERRLRRVRGVLRKRSDVRRGKSWVEYGRDVIQRWVLDLVAVRKYVYLSTALVAMSRHGGAKFRLTNWVSRLIKTWWSSCTECAYA
jgi:hypothetical protein